LQIFKEIQRELKNAEDRLILQEKLLKTTISKYNLSHLTQETQIIYGPIQDDEALLLFGLVKALRPKTVLEFGYSSGFSALNFLKALDEDAKLFSYDINPAIPHNDKRFKFFRKSQTEFVFSDVENRKIDLAFFDDGHIFKVNKYAFEQIKNYFAPNAIIVVHDTGLHISNVSTERLQICVCDFENYCGVAHQYEERGFINWIETSYPEWDAIHLHSINIFRHGLTILQKKYSLSMTESDRCEELKILSRNNSNHV
jgi:predicted O-methyltransferase YrrM